VRELTTSPPYAPNVMEIWEPKHPATLWATPGLLRDCFSFYLYIDDLRSELILYSDIVVNMFELNRSINSKWQFLSRATIAF